MNRRLRRRTGPLSAKQKGLRTLGNNSFVRLTYSTLGSVFVCDLGRSHIHTRRHGRGQRQASLGKGKRLHFQLIVLKGMALVTGTVDPIGTPSHLNNSKSTGSEERKRERIPATNHMKISLTLPEIRRSEGQTSWTLERIVRKCFASFVNWLVVHSCTGPPILASLTRGLP